MSAGVDPTEKYLLIKKATIAFITKLSNSSVNSTLGLTFEPPRWWGGLGMGAHMGYQKMTYGDTHLALEMQKY